MTKIPYHQVDHQHPDEGHAAYARGEVLDFGELQMRRVDDDRCEITLDGRSEVMTLDDFMARLDGASRKVGLR